MNNHQEVPCRNCAWLSALQGARVAAIYVSAASAVVGLLLGAAAGAAIGAVFSPLTFGISAPVCCFFGACGGLLLGGALGAGGGALFGTCLGGFCFAAELPLGWTKPRYSQQVLAALLLTGLTGPLCAAVGAFLGLLSGAFLGLIAGLLLAPFTFGLSVPICAALGGIFGAAVDAATGAGVGMSLSIFLVRYRATFMAGGCRLFAPVISLLNRWRFRLAMFIAPNLDVAAKKNDPEVQEENFEDVREEPSAKPRRRRRARVRKAISSTIS